MDNLPLAASQIRKVVITSICDAASGCSFERRFSDNNEARTGTVRFRDDAVLLRGLALARPITVKIKRLASGAGGLPLPTRMTAEAAGFDLPAAVDKPVKLKPGDIRLVPCGFAMAIPRGYEAQVRPRSGLASRFGITMANAPGTIDSDYRGEVHVPLINLGRKNFTVERGMRIAQMLILPVPSVKLIEVEELDETKRGTRGFGHTGH